MKILRFLCVKKSKTFITIAREKILFQIDNNDIRSLHVFLFGIVVAFGFQTYGQNSVKVK